MPAKPESLLVKWRWTRSIWVIFEVWYIRDHTHDAYSNSGLTYTLKACISVDMSFEIKHLEIRQALANALATTWLMCTVNASLLSTSTPKSFNITCRRNNVITKFQVNVWLMASSTNYSNWYGVCRPTCNRLFGNSTQLQLDLMRILAV
jgi:hypothetical protein